MKRFISPIATSIILILTLVCLASCSKNNAVANTDTNVANIANKTIKFTFLVGTGNFARFSGKSLVNQFSSVADGTFTSVGVGDSKVPKHTGIYKIENSDQANQVVLSVSHKGGLFKADSYTATLNFSNNTFSLQGKANNKPFSGSGIFQVINNKQ